MTPLTENLAKTSNKAKIAQVMRDDALVWSYGNILLPRGVQWSFEGERRWQRALFQDPSQKMVLRKSAQVGISTTAVCRLLHFLAYHPAYAMYTLPRRDDVTDFVNLYADPIIDNSSYLRRIKELVGEKQVDNSRIKQFRVNEHHSSFVIFMEASVEPRMIPVDFMINDEIDKSDQDNIEIFNARQADSQYKINYKFSTPSLEGAGIDPYFRNSTQNYWHVKCPHCNHWNKLDWETNFHEPSLSMDAHLGCMRCHEKLTPEMIVGGQWVSLGYQGEGVASGYQISNLLMPYSRPIEAIYKEYQETKSMKNFHNLTLGMPYTSSTDSMTFGAFRDNCFISPYRREEKREPGGSYFVGIDQGNDLHVVVGRAYGSQLRIVAAYFIPYERKNGFKNAGELISRYDAISIIDGGPNTHPARSLQGEFPRGRVYLSGYGQYKDEFAYGKGEFGGESGRVSISRTEAFDDLRDAVVSGRIQLWGSVKPMDGQVAEIISHCLAIKRDEVIKNNKGVEEKQAIWVATGPDHYAHALLFCYMAWKFIASRRYGAVAVGASDVATEAAVDAYEKEIADLMQHVEALQQEENELARKEIQMETGRALRIA